MRTRIFVRDVSTMSGTDYNLCYNAVLNTERNPQPGSMRPMLMRCWDPTDEPTGTAYMIKDLDTGELLAWALRFQRSRQSSFNVYYYVKPEHRRKGYGARLTQRVKRDCPTFYVHPWNLASQRFFSTLGAPTVHRPVLVTP